MADNPQQTVRELRELVIAYAKQETVDPLKRTEALRRASASPARCSSAPASFFLAIGGLRAMQQYGGWLVHGNWSWVPYFVDRRGARPARRPRLDGPLAQGAQAGEEQGSMSTKPDVVPDRKITRDDIENKLKELQGEVDQQAEAAKVPAIAIAVGVVGA